MTATGSEPWLSVLMPVFNGAATLGKSLDSMARQAQGVEVVIVDQGSSDESRDIAASFSDRIDLRLISAPENANWVQNTNLALQSARGAHCTILHQDDIWLPGRGDALGRMFAAHPEAALWVHAAHFLGEADRVVGRFAPPFGDKARLISGKEAHERLIVQNTMALPAVAFRRDTALRLGGLDESLWYTADWDFWLKLILAGPLSWSPKALAGFRLHPGSQTMRRSHDAEEFRAQLEVPFQRHCAGAGADVLKRARMSNAMNVWLAGRYHGNPAPMRPLIQHLAGLGPMGAWRFFRDSRLIQRLVPRLRMGLRTRRRP